jgi:hypothetical protein
MNLNNAALVSRRYLAGLLVPVIAFGALLVTATPVVAEPTTYSVQVVNEAGGPLDSIDVVACYHSDSNQYVCMSSVRSVAGVVSIPLASISLPDSTGYVYLSAGGGENSTYSRSHASFFVENGIPTGTTQLKMNKAKWVTVKVTVLEGSPATAVVGAQVSLTGLPVWQSALTDVHGVASFNADVSSLDETSVVTAELNGNATGHESKSQTVVKTEGVWTAQISTRKTSFTLQGVITDENDVTFRNKKVCFQWGFYPANQQIEIETDGDGRYQIEGVYDWVTMRPYSCSARSWLQVRHDYQSIRYQATSSSTWDVQMKITGIRVQVTDNTRATVPGLEVCLFEVGSNIDHCQRQRTNGNGIAIFHDLRPGAQYKAAYKIQEHSQDLVIFEEKVNATPKTTIDNQIVDDSIVLTRLSDTLDTSARVEGRVLGSSGAALSNVTVTIWVSQNPWRERSQFQVAVKTDPDGKFSLSNIPRGNISLSTLADGYRTYYTGIENSSRDVYNIGDIRLRTVISGNFEYSGVVRDTRGNPLPNIRVMLSPSWESGETSRQISTDQQGKFRFTGLPGGYTSLYTFGLSQTLKFRGTSLFLTDDMVDQVLVLTDLNPTGASRTAQVSGRLLEYLDINGPESATPVANVCLFVSPRSGGQGFSAKTDSSGNWSVSGLIEGAEYYVHYQGFCREDRPFPQSFDHQNKYEYLSYENTLIAKTSGGTTQEVRLREISRSGPGSVSGRVKDADSYENLSGFTVSIHRSWGGIQIDPVTTDERGEYSFPSLPEGEYYLSVSSGDDGVSSLYQPTSISVEIGTTANRANVFLTRNSRSVNEGVVSGNFLDEEENPHGGGYVTVWDRDDFSVSGHTNTDNDGNFTISGLPVGVELSLRIIPFWKEIAQLFMKFTIPDSKSWVLEDVSLQSGVIITGQVSGLLVEEDTFSLPVVAELLDSTTKEVIQRNEADRTTGRYSFTQVPRGDFLIRYTQNSPMVAPEQYGDGDFGFSSAELPSFKPVYWDGTKFGTTELADAIEVTVAGVALTGKNVTVTKGSTLFGSVSVATPDGETKLTGTRQVTMTVFKKQSNEDWEKLTTALISGYTQYEYQVVGLAAGEYKLQFSDIRRGNNALATSFNAEEIILEVGKRRSYNHTMTAAPPERSAEAFDLDDLAPDLLEQLRDEISVSAQPDSGAELEIFVGTEFAGEYVSAFANSTPVMLGTWQQVDSRGYISVTPPSTLLAGEHRIAVQDVRGVVFGWTPVTIQKPSAAKAKATPSDSQLASPLVMTNEGKQAESKPKVSLDSKPEGVIDRPGQADWYLPLIATISLAILAGATWIIRTRSPRRLRS